MEEKLTIKNNIEIKPLSNRNLPDEPEPLKKKTGRIQQHLASIVVSILPCIFGTAIGWPSPTLAILKSQESPVGEPLNARESSLLGSLIFAGGIFGTLIWSRVADRFGRKSAGYTIATVFLIGWIIIEFSSSKYGLLLARFIIGLSATGSLILCPLYISEIAEDDIRGTLGSYAVLFMNLGTLLSYCFGAIFSYRVLTGICLIVPIVFIVLFIWLPETPVYLWKRGNRNGAENSLHRLRAGNFTKVQQEIIKLSTLEVRTENTSYSELISTKGNRMGMLIGLGLFAGQQFCGILALLTYATTIFEESGSSFNSDVSTILVGLFQLVASLLSTLLVEKTGRKILLLTSFLFMGISLTILGTFFYLKKCTSVNTETYEWLPVLVLSIYVIMYSLGVGPLPYVVNTEILSPSIRPLAMSVIIFWGTLLTFLCVLIFPYLVMSIGSHGNFWFFAACCYLSFVFTLFMVPETKGVPLAVILDKLNGKETNLYS